jgi:hypothetical protein
MYKHASKLLKQLAYVLIDVHFQSLLANKLRMHDFLK